MKTNNLQQRRSSVSFLIIMSIAVFITCFNTNSMAQKVRQPKAGTPGTWRLIGTTEAKFTGDHDGIAVAGPFDNFRKVKFKVTDAPLRLIKLVITYDNGAPDEIPTAIDIPQGAESRIIDLRGVGTRSIRRIDFWYDTKGVLKGRANVSIFGMK